MSYWSGERLIERIEGENLISPFDKSLIDCAAYTLRVGDEAFVTKDLINAEHQEIKQNLTSETSTGLVNIQPGQFAFLLTYEQVTIPDDAIAFISFKAKYKFRGLINVSGFHVDPGYSGKLIFAVYNAGAVAIILQRKEPIFLIFYSDVDRTTKYKYKNSGMNEIGSGLIQNMAGGQVFSPILLQRKIERLEEAQSTLQNKQTELQNKQSALVANASAAFKIAIFTGGIIASLIVALFNIDIVKVGVGGWVRDAIEANVAYRKAEEKSSKSIEMTLQTENKTEVIGRELNRKPQPIESKAEEILPKSNSEPQSVESKSEK